MMRAKTILARFGLSIALGVFCVLAMCDFLNANAMGFIEDSFNFALANIGIVAALKIISGALPLTSGISDILDKIFNFFFLANILIGLQYVLLIVSKILFVKILIICAFVLHLMPKIGSLATKILIILLFINPGLNLYISAIKVVSNEANMAINDDISRKMNGIKNMLGISDSQIPEIDLELSDTRSGMQKFIGELGLLSNSINKGTQKALDVATSPLDSAQKALDEAKEKILKGISAIGSALNVVLNLTIKYILNVFFLYFLMPIVYFYILYRVLSSSNLESLRTNIPKMRESSAK